MANEIYSNNVPQNAMIQKPLIALLDGRDCTVEMKILKEVGAVAFCDTNLVSEVHDRVLNEAVVALTFNTIPLDKEALEQFKSLKLIVCICSDCDSIDVKAAAKMGIAVCTVPGYDIEESADSTLCMILNLYRRTYWLANMLKDDQKVCGPEGIQAAAVGCTRIRGDTLGLVGFGRVGSAVALRARAFGFRVIFYDPHVKEGVEHSLGFERVHSLQDLFSQSHCISLHCSLNEETDRLIRAETIAMMRPGTFLVNTANGRLVDEDDLADSLEKAQIRAAALDVVAVEPFVLEESPLKDAPNVLVTPHAAFYSSQSMEEMRTEAANEVRRAITSRYFFDGLRHCVNRPNLPPVSGGPIMGARESPIGPVPPMVNYFPQMAPFQIHQQLMALHNGGFRFPGPSMPLYNLMPGYGGPPESPQRPVSAGQAGEGDHVGTFTNHQG